MIMKTNLEIIVTELINLEALLIKVVTTFLNKNLVFIDSMQFVNSSLDKLVKHLLDEDFKYLVEDFGSENLELLK